MSVIYLTRFTVGIIIIIIKIIFYKLIAHRVMSPNKPMKR